MSSRKSSRSTKSVDYSNMIISDDSEDDFENRSSNETSSGKSRGSARPPPKTRYMDNDDEFLEAVEQSLSAPNEANTDQLKPQTEDDVQSDPGSDVYIPNDDSGSEFEPDNALVEDDFPQDDESDWDAEDEFEPPKKKAKKSTKSSAKPKETKAKSKKASPKKQTSPKKKATPKSAPKSTPVAKPAKKVAKKVSATKARVSASPVSKSSSLSQAPRLGLKAQPFKAPQQIAAGSNKTSNQSPGLRRIRVGLSRSSPVPSLHKRS